ncbi:MAG TPA: choice-of-anchor D domain-containing protein [Candidatus Didemnitutus sp.]|nr:choice-of-anchor D domain-containing protein [Candidatus Didemnitutus sp.]
MNRVFVALFLLFSSGTLLAGVPGWRTVQRLSRPLTGHGVTMVHTGDLLVVGGSDATGATVSDVWVVRGATGQRVQALAGLSVPRARFALVTVQLGTESVVYVIGGYTGSSGAYASSDVVDVIRYDAGQNNWRCSRSGTLPVAVGDVRAVFDGTSSIIVSGGTTQTSGLMNTGPASTVSSSITVSNGAIRQLGDHVAARSAHGAYRFLDPTNLWRVIVAGGDAQLPSSAELLAGTTWDGRANPPRVYRKFLADVSDISGTARAFGGEDAGIPQATTEWYDPKSGWRQAPRMNEARSRMGTTLVAGPRDTAPAYLVVGGMGTTGALSTTELFVMPSATAPTGSFETFHTTQQAAAFRGVAMSGVNLPFVIGGGPSDLVEVLQPLDAPDVTFPNTEVGARSDSVVVTITNTWLLPITINALRTVGDPDFLVASDTNTIILAPGASRNILAWFRPTAQGPRLARLALEMGPVADTVVLRGNGLASTIELLAGVVDHGDVNVGTPSRICLPLLVNNGSDTAIVDSIVVPGGLGVVIESPQGRTKVAPGDSLIICVVYTPASRSTLSTSGSISIGNRTYPFGIIGRGIRTTGVVRVGVDCDTISAVRGDSAVFTITLENVADRPVIITDIVIDAAVANTAWLLNPSILPLTIQPGVAVPVDVEVVVQREGREQFTIRCTSNSDSAMTNATCVVTRSRTLIPSVGSLDLGLLCVGDSVTKSFTYTNASAIDTIVISTADLENVAGTLSLTAPFSVAPRSSVEVRVTINAVTAGPLNGRINLTSAQGSSIVPISGDVLPSVTVRPSAIDAVPGDRRTTRISFEGVTSTTTSILLRHSPRMFSVRGAQSVAGSTPINASTSTQTASNGTSINIVWSAVPVGGVANIDLDIDVLRGDEALARMYAVRLNDTTDCLLSDTVLVRVDTGCGGERSGVKLTSQPSMTIFPQPVRESMQVLVHLPQPGMRVELVDVNGIVLKQVLLGPSILPSAGQASLGVTVDGLPAGVVIARLVSDAGLFHSLPVIIAP